MAKHSTVANHVGWSAVRAFLFFLSMLLHLATSLETAYTITLDGPQSLREGRKLFDARDYEAAMPYFWRAVLLQANHASEYSVEESFQGFIQCYSVQDRTADGFVFIASESFQRGQKEMAEKYLEQALAIEPDNDNAVALQGRMLGTSSAASGGNVASSQTDTKKAEDKKKKKRTPFQAPYGSAEAEDPLAGKTPEELYEYGSKLFSRRNYEYCADIFELSCMRSDYTLGPSCSNAVYCRMMLTDWGFNGTGFDEDMYRLEEMTSMETELYRRGSEEEFQWQRATSVHPHMMLGYPVKPMLKRFVAESVAFMDEMSARVTQSGMVDPLPDDLPYDLKAERSRYIQEASEPGFRVKVGFIGSGFNSKAVLYLSQDIFRFYDRSKIEMHIFSLGPPDNDNFINIGMRGVDWRKRVSKHVDHFHDIEELKNSHIEMARYVRARDIHILIEWDGYARQGERAQGLMALKPAPVQILHQEYLGTSGAKYVDYIFTDKVTSPPHLAYLYTEQFIYLPNHFFSKGHAVQDEVHPPTYDYEKPKGSKYVLGTGSPQHNRCMAKNIRKPKFVFCNFNKFLKNNPETMRSWIRILKQVPDSILCLLENPSSGVNYIRRFVHEATGEPTTHYDERTGREVTDFIPGEDGDALNDRIHFLPWENNPFDHQRRNQDFCNLMLDSHPYNGHTVAQDALYAGVPIVTRSDGDDMSSRVTTSANVVLGLEELNAYEGPKQYEDIAIELGTDERKFLDVRRRLIDTALQRNPMHPYWDAPRYVKNLEAGLIAAWDRFLSGQEADTITVAESADAARGTYDPVLINNPSDRLDFHDEL